jgi:WD40 repeat protein
MTTIGVDLGKKEKKDFAPYDAVAFRPDGRRRAGRTRDHHGVEVTDTLLGVRSVTMGRRKVDVTALRYDPRGEALAAGYADGAIALFHPDTQERLGSWSGLEGPVHELAVGPGGEWVAALVGEGRKLAVMVPDEPLHVLKRRGVRCLRATPDGLLLLGGDEAIVGFTPLDPEATARLHLEAEGRVEALAISPDGTRLAAGARDGPVWIYLLDSPQGPVLEQVWHGGAALTSQGVAFSTDGALIAASQADDPLRLSVVRVAGLESVAWYNVMLQAPKAVNFLPDHRSLVYAGGLSAGTAGKWLGSDAWKREMEAVKGR